MSENLGPDPLTDPVEVAPDEPTPNAEPPAEDEKVPATDEERVIAVDGDDPADIEEKLRQHHEAHGA